MIWHLQTHHPVGAPDQRAVWEKFLLFNMTLLNYKKLRTANSQTGIPQTLTYPSIPETGLGDLNFDGFWLVRF